MTDGKTAKNKNNRREKWNATKFAAALFAVLLCALMICGCAAKTEAEKKVAKELDALKTSESVGSEVSDMKKMLSEEGGKNFDAFLKKLRDFDYEITGASEEEDHATVKVRIKTYDFGRAYLAEWTDYLREHGDSLSGDDELTGFYEELFKRLADLDKKESIKDVEIVCIKPLDNGEWVADIKDNKQLQDAVFGGMMSEMEALAEE